VPAIRSPFSSRPSSHCAGGPNQFGPKGNFSPVGFDAICRRLSIMNSPEVRAILRWLRTAGAYGLGAGLNWAANNVGLLPLNPVTIGLIGSLVAAANKYARDRGWIILGV